MTIEQDLVRVLKKLEGHLANASTTASSSAPNKGRVGGGKQDGEKSFKATAASLDALSDSTNRLDKSFIGLNKTVLATRASFVGLNKAVRKTKTVKAPEETLSSKAPNAPAGGPILNIPVSDLLKNNKIFNASTVSASAALSSSTTKLSAFSLALVALPTVLFEFGKIIDRLTNDTFHLLSQGVGAKSLGTLYFDAARAGMSLQEYTSLLQDSMPAVSRFKDLDTFGDTVHRVNSNLGNLGVFGKDAATLSASMLSTGAQLGIAQNNLEAGANGQIKVFESLRASTMITADQFRALSEEIGQTQEVQSELLGLDQSERAQRVNDVLKMKTLGLAMGASAAASKALGDALIQQRNLTAQQRFQSAGTIRQAGAITGMGAAETEELAKLSRKKNLTAEEGARAQQLGSKLQSQLEKMMNSGEISQEHIAEQLQARLNEAGIGRLLTASGNAELSKQSGPIANESLNKAANELEKAAGALLTAATGLAANPIAASITAIVGAVMAGLIGKKVFSALMGGRGAKAGAIADTPTVSKDAIPKVSVKGDSPTVSKDAIPKVSVKGDSPTIRDKLANVLQTINPLSKSPNVPTPSPSMPGDVSPKTNMMAAGKKTAAGLADTVFDLLPNMFKNGVKSIPVVGMLGGLLVDGIGEAVTGSVNAAFDPNGENGLMGRIGNVIFASITGTLGGIADLVDSVVGMFTDNGLNLRNAWDKFAVTMRIGFFEMLASLIESLPFGKNSDFAKSMRESAATAQLVYDQLSEDSSATVSSVGQRNKDLAKAKDESAKQVKAIDANINKVVHSTVGLANTAINDARILATPAPQQQKSSVNAVEPQAEAKPQTVNNNSNTNTTVNNKSQTSGDTRTIEAQTQQTQNDKLVEIIDNLRATLDSQNALLETLTRVLKNSSNADTSMLLSRLSGQL